MMPFKRLVCKTIKHSASTKYHQLTVTPFSRNVVSIRKFSRNISPQNTSPPESSESKEKAEQFYALGTKEYGNNNFSQALQHFKKAEEFLPDHPFIVFMLAHVNEMLENFKQSYNYYLQYIDIENACELDKLSDEYQELFNDKIVKAWLGAGNCVKSIGNFEEAINFYSKAVEFTMFPFHKTAYYNRASCYFELGKFREAIDDFTIAADYFTQENNEGLVGISTVSSELDPSLCYFFRAKCKWQLGEIESAAKDLEMLINDYEQIEKNKSIHHNVLKETQCRLEAYLMIFQANLSMGEYDKFSANMERLEKNDGKHLTNYYLSNIHMLKGDYYMFVKNNVESALENFTKSCEFGPGNCAAHIKAAILHNMKKEKSKALQLVKRALEIEPTNDDAKKVLEMLNR